MFPWFSILNINIGNFFEVCGEKNNLCLKIQKLLITYMSLMKNNIKLFFQSLISNNAAIDAGRKKPWYAAIILFLISVVLAVLPTTVLELKKQGDKNFNSTTYLAREALREFSEEIKDDDGMVVIKVDKKESYLVGRNSETFGDLDSKTMPYNYKFRYSSNENVNDVYTALNAEKVSYFIFTPDTVYIHIVNPENHDTVALNLMCINAYKKVGETELKDSFVEGTDKTDSIEKTWANWKVLIRELYNQTRLRSAAIQLGILSAVNVGIILIMGFMVWVLTRGKNNPYRIFNVWECYKIVFWAGLCPAILTSGLGFLIKSFASTIFPLLLGVRVMWLSMKSLRPDGSGYANN